MTAEHWSGSAVRSTWLAISGLGVDKIMRRAGLTTSFGAGIPMLPPRWTLRPEVGHRVGIVTLGAYYQFADLAIDSAIGHTVGSKVQVAIGRVKLYATGSYRSDVFPDSAAQTWVAGLGLTGKL